MVVLAELVWVVRSAYEHEKGIVVSVVRQILQTAELTVEDPALAWAARPLLSDPGVRNRESWLLFSELLEKCDIRPGDVAGISR